MPMAADGGTPVAPRLWLSASWAVSSCQNKSRLVPRARASANRRERSVGRSQEKDGSRGPEIDAARLSEAPSSEGWFLRPDRDAVAGSAGGAG